MHAIARLFQIIVQIGFSLNRRAIAPLRAIKDGCTDSIVDFSRRLFHKRPRIRRRHIAREVIVSDLNSKRHIEIASTIIECLAQHRHIAVCSELYDLKAMLSPLVVGLQYSPYTLTFAVPTEIARHALAKHIDDILSDGDCTDIAPPAISTYAELDRLQTTRQNAQNTLCIAWITPIVFQDYSANMLFYALNRRAFDRVVFAWGYGTIESLDNASNRALHRLYDDLHVLQYNIQTPTPTHIAIDYIGRAKDIAATRAPYPSDEFWHWLRRSTPYIYANDCETLRLLAHAASVHHRPAVQLDAIDSHPHFDKKAKSYLAMSPDSDFSTFPKPITHVIGIDAFGTSIHALPIYMDIERPEKTKATKTETTQSAKTGHSKTQVYTLCQSEFSLLCAMIPSDDNRQNDDNSIDEVPFIAWTVFNTLSEYHQIDLFALHEIVANITKLSTELDHLSTQSTDLSTNLWNHSTDLSTSDAKFSTELGNLSTTRVANGHYTRGEDAKSRAHSILQSILNDWRDRKLIAIERTFDDRMATITLRPESKKCFAGVADLHAIAPLCQYRHEAEITTPNRESITRVAVSFFDLEASALFRTQQSAYRKYIHPRPNTWLVQPAQSFEFPLWIDALPIELTHREAQCIESIIRHPSLQHDSIDLCDAGLEKYREITARFAPYFRHTPASQILAIARRDCIDIWAFSGARHHALCAIILDCLLSEYGVEIGYGNLAIHLRWNTLQMPNAIDMAKLVCLLMRSIARVSHDDLPDIVKRALRTKFDKYHPMGWEAQILPQTWISQKAQDAYESMQNGLLKRDICTFIVDESDGSVRCDDITDLCDDIDANRDIAHIDTAWHEIDIAIRERKNTQAMQTSMPSPCQKAIDDLLQNVDDTKLTCAIELRKCVDNRAMNAYHSTCVRDLRKCVSNRAMNTDNSTTKDDDLHKCIEEVTMNTKDIDNAKDTGIDRTTAINGDFSHIALRSETCPWHPSDDYLHTELPWYYIDNTRDFNRAMGIILTQPYIGLDVETTLYDQSLRLIQIGCRSETFLIDPLCLDITGLSHVMSHPGIVKVIHNASFEKRVLAQHGIQIAPITDTMSLSRSIFGSKAVGGHKLTSLCERVFGRGLCKECQTSNWSARPLSRMQLEYAALDAEILVRLYPRLTRSNASMF